MTRRPDPGCSVVRGLSTGVTSRGTAGEVTVGCLKRDRRRNDRMWYAESTCLSLSLPLDRKEPHMATYAIGIDLGTTNSVIAYTRLDQDAAQPQVLSVPQLVAPATVESRLQLPSFLYLGSEREADTGNYDLPWHQGGQDAVGELARQQAAAMPMRTVAATKSWLCYSRVDRHQPILPWGPPVRCPRSPRWTCPVGIWRTSSPPGTMSFL